MCAIGWLSLNHYAGGDGCGRKAYPPYATLVTGATDLGIVNMGGCILICGLDGQQQTTLPATIAGTITSAPIAVAGTMIPRFAMQALDGSKSPDGLLNLWNLAMPVFNESMTPTFSTVAGSCDGISPYCATYGLVVPSQSPVHPVSGGTLQATVSPVYSIYAALGTYECVPAYASSLIQSDGKSFRYGDTGCAVDRAKHQPDKLPLMPTRVSNECAGNADWAPMTLNELEVVSIDRLSPE